MFRKLAVVCAAATALLTFAAAPAAASVDDFVGQWANQDADTSGVTRVSITRQPSGARVRVFGRCHPNDCDWGEVIAVPFAQSAGGNANADARVLMASYNLPLGRKTVIIRLNGANLAYEVFTDFNDARADYLESGRLRRLGIVPPLPFPRPGVGGRPVRDTLDEDCVGFTPGALRVVNIGGRWKIAEGSHWIADFGANRAEADQAMAIILRYGFTSQCFVARPNASMTYWRRGSGVPTGAAAGAFPNEDCLHVNPANVQARLTGGAWKVVDGNVWVLDYGANRANAEHAVEVIQHYNLNTQCFVGRPDPSMQYWLSR